MSLTQWSLCLASLLLVSSGQDQQSNTSAHYLFSSIRDLRLQQQMHPRRNQFQYRQTPFTAPVSQDANTAIDVHSPLVIRKTDKVEEGPQTEEFKQQNAPLRRVHNTRNGATGPSAEEPPAHSHQAQTQSQSPSQTQPPPLELTRGELANLYQKAVRKGNTVRLNAEGAPIQAAVHHLDEGDDHANHHEGDNRGYYYYYYPLKSFMHELSSHSQSHDHDRDNGHHDDHDHYPPAENHYHDADSVKSGSHSHESPHVYEHTHQHNVHIEPMKAEMEADKKKGLEPLFMAISGFIGMTVMFILSMLMMPKFGHALKSRHRTKTEDEIDVVRVVMSALDGQDCRERLACEMGKAANAFNLYDNRLVKLVRRIGPASIRRRIDKIGKYTEKKFKCALIQCKRKGAPNVL